MNISIRADALSTDEFENFAVKIAQKRFKNNGLHGFQEGRDDGIDGIDDVRSPSIVVQAKRWQATKSKSTAVKSLKDEIDKIKATSEKYNWNTPFQYILVTSMGLTPANLKEIRDYVDAEFPGHISSDKNILYDSVLTDLAEYREYKPIFEKYSLIEKDLSKVLKQNRLNAIEAESIDYLSDIDFKYIVETSFVKNAYQTLQNEHILLIQGPPGIGKTTTCAVLGNLFVNNTINNFSAIVRKVEEINDVLKLYNENYRDSPSDNLFVIFDDFLGRNQFDVSERVLPDVGKICSTATNTKNLFICLNTRTQILKTANDSNSEFKRIVNKKFTDNTNLVIDLAQYSDIDKAKILRKTFERKFSELSEDGQILLNNRYEQLRHHSYQHIVTHRNYFPRLIDLIVGSYDQTDEDFYSYILENLENPRELYKELFNKLDDDEKYLLFSIYLFSNQPVKRLDLVKSLEPVIQTTFNINNALKRLDGSWLSFTKNNIGSSSTEDGVDFLNPSIKDFLEVSIEEDFGTMAQSIIQGSVYLEQLSPHIEKEELYKRIYNQWHLFNDREQFIGERIISLIRFGETPDELDEYRRLLQNYSGEWGSNTYRNGWEEIVDTIYSSENLVFMSIFLTTLDTNNEFVDRLLNSKYFKLHVIDNMVDKIANMIANVYYRDNFYTNHFSGTHFYPQFQKRKCELLQEKLDDYDTVEWYSFDWRVFDKSSMTVEKVKSLILIDFENKNRFSWDRIDIRTLDTSELGNNIEYFFEAEDDDEVDESNLDVNTTSKETVESILDRPLSDIY